MAQEGGLIRKVRLLLDRRSADKVAKDSQRALDKGTDPKKAKKNLGEVEGGLGRLKKAAVKVGAAIAAAFGIRAIIRFARESVRAFGAFDLAMNRSLAIMGEVDEAMRERMAKTARDVAKDLNLSAASVAEGYFFLASAGLNAEQSIRALPQAATFAKAGAFDLATAVDLLTDSQSALGLTVDDTTQNLKNQTRVSDVLVKANTLANATVQQFSESLTSEAGASLKIFNRDLEEGVAVLAVYADQGTKGAVAGSNLSRVLRLMTMAATNNREELAALGIQMTDAHGNMLPFADIVESLTNALHGMSDTQRAAALESIGFKARIQQAIMPLLGSADAIREYERELRVAGGTTQDVSDNQMVAFSEQWGRVQRKVEDLRIELGEKLAPVLMGVANNFDDLVLAVVSLTKALLVGGAVLAVGRFVAVAKAAKTAVDAWRLSMAGALTLIGPKGWFILGVAALAEVFRRQGKAARDAADDLETYRESLQSMSEDELEDQLAAIARQREIVQRQLDAAEAAGNKMREIDARRRLERIRQFGLEVIGLLNGIRGAGDGGGDTLTPPKAPPSSRDETALKARIALLGKARELALLTTEHAAELLRLQQTTANELTGQNLTLERKVELMERLIELGDMSRGVSVTPRVELAGTGLPTDFSMPRNVRASIQDDITWLEQNWQAMESAGIGAAMGVTGAWQDAFALIGQEGETLGSFFETLGAGIAGAMLGGIAEFAAGKVAQNIAWGIEKIAMGLGFASTGNFPSAALAKASASQHFVAAAGWAALAGGAGAAQSAVAGGGRGGLSGGVPTGATDIGGRIADRQITAPEINIFIDPLTGQVNNPEFQDTVGAAVQGARDTFGKNARINVRPRTRSG